MANYEEKKVYYIPAFVERIDELGNYPVKVNLPIGEERLAVQFEDLPDLMFTAEEIIGKSSPETEELNKKIAVLKCDINRRDTTIIDRNAQISALEVRLSELETLLKEVMATRDEAVKQNNELIAENEHQKSACEEQKRLAQNWKENANKLDKEKEELFDERNVAMERLDTAKEAITLLQQENSSLKSKLEDAEVMCGNAVDTSRKRQQKIATMEEVIVSLVEKIRRLEGDD